MPEPLTIEQREQILSLLRTSPIPGSAEIAEKVGVTTQQVAGIKANLSKLESRNDGNGERVDVEAVDTAFGLERDLQNALRTNIAQLDPGLTIVDGGREQVLPVGKIDITARDQTGTTVVIELKTATADRDAVGQILSYMGELMVESPSVRGMLIARDFSPRAVAAARAAPNIELVRYGFRFSFEKVFPSIASAS
jgi:RecB family endonuclease NucS